MKKVSIFFILLIITLTNNNDSKDTILMLFVFGVTYYFLLKTIQEIYDYRQRKRLENEIAEIFNNDFILSVKRELAILKIKNEFRKISSSELCADQPDKNSGQLL